MIANKIIGNLLFSIMYLFTIGNGSFCVTSPLTQQTYTKMKISIWCHLSYLTWLLHFGPFILGEKECFYYKDVALQGINPTPSVCAASVLALVTPTLYTAIFSTKLLQPVLPAVWHLTPSLSHPKGCVVGSRWHSTELNVQMPACSTTWQCSRD